MDLEQLWERMGFDPAALQAQPGRYHAPYSLDPGPGQEFGLRLVRYGRYANNLLQAANAIALARAIGWRWVQLCEIDFLRSFESLEIDGVTLLHPGAPPPADARFLCGPFFRRADFGPWVRKRKDPEMLAIISGTVRHLLQLPVAETPDDQLVIHIRSGDVFKVAPNKRYGQPPLAFYTRIIETLREAGEIASVCVVFENMANPCVAALVDYLDRTDMPYRLQSGSFAEDAAVIFGARRLVLGVGTFGPGVAATSDRLREVYAFRQTGFSKLPRLERVWLVEAGADYIPPEGWTGSDAQRAMMLSYPDDQLELVKLV